MDRSANLRLGCPVWACTAWRGSLFTRRAARDDYLPQYASVFDAVEGNSTFYGLPTEATVVRWHEQVPRHFRFCFKFPQVITHRMLLRYADAETSEFLFLLEPLRDRLGPLLLQLPPNFGAADLHVLTHYLDGLPGGFPYAVEVRHPEFFDGGAFEAALDDALQPGRELAGAGAGRGVAGDRGAQGRAGGAGEGADAVQGLVQGGAEAEQVAARVDRKSVV